MAGEAGLRTVWTDATVVVTGGTGTFGNAFTRRMLDLPIRSLRIFSRDEFKQSLMAERFADSRMRFLLGDVRDRERLRRAFDGATIVVHAAALKQVPASERDPIEFVRTNVLGSMNVVEAALDAGVPTVMGISSDKAAAPTNLYGVTKATMEKLFTSSNETYGARTAFSCVRYGNVVGSRGSVIPVFLRQAASGTLTLTDERMTRFWISIGDAVEFVVRRIEEMHGGELFVPRIPSIRIPDLAQAIAPTATVRYTGIRPGEKLHETMVTADESRTAFAHADHYVINGAARSGPAWSYSSDANENFLTVSEIAAALPAALAQAA